MIHIYTPYKWGDLSVLKPGITRAMIRHDSPVRSAKTPGFPTPKAGAIAMSIAGGIQLGMSHESLTTGVRYEHLSITHMLHGAGIFKYIYLHHLGDFVRATVGIHIPAPWSIWGMGDYHD